MDPEVAGSKPVTHPIPSHDNCLIYGGFPGFIRHPNPSRLRGGCGFCMKSRLREWSIESIYGLFIPTWNQMSVTIHGDLDRRMTHLLFDVYRALAVLEKK